VRQRCSAFWSLISLRFRATLGRSERDYGYFSLPVKVRSSLTGREKYAGRNSLSHRLGSVAAVVATAERELSYEDRPHGEDMLSPADAARVAGRSVRTIRRAYRAGSLIAYRDGNGRGVRIRRDDLRDWMMATSAVSLSRPSDGMERAPLGFEQKMAHTGRGAPKKRVSENRALLRAARERRR